MTSSTVEALKPCPFCGGPAKYARVGNIVNCAGTVSIHCPGVGATTGAERWNTRPKIEAQGSEPGGARWRPRAELLAMLDGLLATYMKGERLPDVVDMSALSEAAECIRALTRPDPSLGSREAVHKAVYEACESYECCEYASERGPVVDRFTDRILALSPSSLGMEGVREALDALDNIGCPLAGGKTFDVCPKCHATSSQNCGRWVGAVSELEKSVRQALASISTPSGEVG